MTGKTVDGRAHVYGCCLVTETVHRRNWRLVRIERLHSIGPRSATTSGYQGADNQQRYSNLHDAFARRRRAHLKRLKRLKGVGETQASCSIVTATSPFAERRTLLPSTSATRLPSM